MSTYTTQAIPLRMQSFTRDDRLVVLYTRDHGKITALVRGGKKIKTKLASHAQLYSVCEVMIAPGKRLDILAGIQTQQVFDRIQGSLDRRMLTQSLFDVVSLVAADNHVERGIFELLEQWLIQCNSQTLRDDQEVLLLITISKFLTMLGYETPIEMNRFSAITTMLHQSAQVDVLRWFEYIDQVMHTNNKKSISQTLREYVQHVAEFELRGLNVYYESIVV